MSIVAKRSPISSTAEHLLIWESAKLLKYFCGKKDILHYYDIQRCKFVSTVNKKIPFHSKFLSALDTQFHTVVLLLSFDQALRQQVFI